MRTAPQFLAASFVLLVLLAAHASAQVTTGSITGRVSDAQGAAVPNAAVTARSKATGRERTATTNEAGDYTLADLPAGTYEVTVESKGFSKALLAALDVNVGATVTQNFDLKPGELSETVQVTSEAALVQTTTSELGRNITPTEVRELPLINRTFASLSIVAPEARPVGNFDPTKTRVGNIGFNGGDGRQLDVNVDGGDNKDNVVGSLLQNFAYESIQEFQVLQHRWTAESGRSVGAVVNVVSKSGSNEFHGSLFGTYRNESLRARDFFEKQTTDPKPKFNREEFGGSLGGPIKKDKLFFFGALERFRERQNILVNPALLPEINAIPGVTASSTIPTPYNDTLLTAKIDHHLTSKQAMFYRFSFQKNDSPNDQFDPSQPGDLSNGNTNNNKLYSFVVNHTYTVGPTSLNQFTFQYQKFQNDILAVTTNPNIVFPSVQSGANVNVPQETIQRKLQFRDDYSFIAGRHTLKAGVNYIHTKLDGFFFFGANGYQIFFFDDPLTIKNNTNGLYPQGFATPGAVNEITFSTGEGDTGQEPFHQLALYLQDDFKVTPRLTLNLGLRWDANIRLLVPQTNNRTMQILRQLNEPRAQAIAGDADRLARTTPSWREFQPRVGFAWDPKGDGRTVIRGGYGIFFDQLFQNLTLFATQQSNPTIYQTVLDLVNDRVGSGQLATFRFGVDPLPAPPPGFSTANLEAGGFGRINDPTLTDPYVQKFSLGFEHNLGGNYVLSSDYVHTIGIHENRVQNVNPRLNFCNPAFPGAVPASPQCVRGANTRYFDQAFVAAGLGAGRLEQINMFTSTNRSFFDSWTTTLKYRGRRSLYTASYVLSSSRSWGGQPVASYSGNGIAITPEQQFRPEEFGPTRIDERHRVVLSGVFNLPGGFELAPIAQLASARPYSPLAGIDVDGDGRSSVDRLCAGTDPAAVLQSLVAGNGVPAAARARGCTQLDVNSVRDGFVVENGQLQSRSGRFFNVDLRVTRVFNIGEKVKIKPYANFFNLFNVENLSFADRLGTSSAASRATFLQPVSLYGPGFGPPVGVPFTFQLGARL
ncbi:MAG TPA: TonB-dependent receptor, partial [Pyrinomonadaceae bacterium]|nr:TonB-dependent receptor [Pyrinomonadaceae bacterium]